MMASGDARHKSCPASALAASFCRAAASAAMAAMIASALPSASQRMTSATISGTGICATVRKRLAIIAAAARSGVSRNDTRRPGAMHFDRLAAR